VIEVDEALQRRQRVEHPLSPLLDTDALECRFPDSLVVALRAGQRMVSELEVRRQLTFAKQCRSDAGTKGDDETPDPCP